MKKNLKKLLFVVAVILLYIGYTNYEKLDIITGFSAKNVDSGMFLAYRSEASIEHGDDGFSPINLAKNAVNLNDRSVSSTVFGLKKRTAVFREGLGSVLLVGKYNDSLKYKIPFRNFKRINLPFPYGDNPQKDTIFSEVNYPKLNKAVANAFDENGKKIKKTRSVLVIYKDHIIAEKYLKGFTKNTPILGWSMTKSIIGTLYGILQKEGKIDIYKPTQIPQWQHDERAKITFNDLLHMNSGLAWDENYNTLSDVTKMLFLAKNMSKVQLNKPLKYKPNTHWNYSSGTTNLLSGLLRNNFKTYQQYLDFPYKSLIDKIGMHSMLIETDLAGNYVGSSYGWATTRDWAKFGLLYLHQGNWNGDQIIDSTWVKYVQTPTKNSNKRYGAQFWLNAGGHYPDAPKDLYSCNGYQGQLIFIIPSKNMVIVRTGLTEEPEFDLNNFLKSILNSIKS